MQRDQAHTQNELLRRIAVALEKGNVTKAVELSGQRNTELSANGVLDVVKNITDDYASKHKDIPGFEGTLDALENLTNMTEARDYYREKYNAALDKCKSDTMYDCPCSSCEENPTTTFSNKELHEGKLHTDDGYQEDDIVHNDYLNDLVTDMNQIEYSNFHRDLSLSFAQDGAASMTNFIYELEYEECLGAIKKALFISGDDDYVKNYLGDEKRATNYVKDVLEHRSQDKYADDPNLEVQMNQDDPYTYDNNLREFHCGVVNDSDFNIRKTADSYQAALDCETHFTSKKECIMDYITNEFGILGARYTDIIKFAYYLGSPNAPKYTSANRGYYSCAFNVRMSGYLIQGGKDQLVKGINNEGKEKYFALSFVDQATDYYKRIA